MSYGVIAFVSTHDAMAAEKLLKPLLPVTMMPTPRCITASCGISLRFALEDTEKVRQAAQSLSGYQLYRIDDGSYTPL